MNKQLLSLLLPIAILGAACGADDTSDGDGSGEDAGNGSGDAGTDGGTDAGSDGGDDTTDAGTDTLEDVGTDTLEDTSADTAADGSGEDTSTDVTIEAFTISGHVSIRDRGVAGIEVALEQGNAGEWELVGSVWTEDAGSFSFTDVVGGDYRVRPVSSQHTYGPAEAVLELTADEGDLDFTLTGSLPPTAVDYWGETSDLAPAFADFGGALQARTAYPIGEDDWYRFELSEGSSYEFFTTFVDERNDTEMFLYEGSGDSLVELDDNDDFIDYDSHIAFTPEVSGEYLIRVHHLEDYCHVGTYLFGADIVVDPDEDGYGAWHDCDQTDAEIYPDSSWYEGDDNSTRPQWRCDGITALAPDANDTFSDNTRETAQPLTFIEFSYEEWMYNYLIADQVRTLNGVDEDWFSFTVPAYSKIEIHSALLEGQEPGFEIFEGSGEVAISDDSSLPSYEEVINDTDAAKQFYARIGQPGEIPVAGTYLIFGITYGTDADEDGYYSNDNYYDDVDTDDTDADVIFCSEPE